MEKAPNVFTIEVLQKWNSYVEMTEEDGSTKWEPARPLGLFSMWHRLECAYMVLVGKADIVIWPGGQ